MSKFWEHFFYVFAYITMGSSYMSPRAYAIMHRLHHAYTDTEKDPHSPRHSKGVIDMMKHTNRVFMGIFRGTFPIEDRFTKNVPDWPAFDRWAMSRTSYVLWSLVYITFYILFAPSIWWFLLIPIHILMGPVHGTIVNWFAHKYGYRNFEVTNTSHNLLPFDILMIGEGYHNNHHKFASNANFGYKWYEPDPTYFVMRIFNFFGIIHLKKQSTQRIVSEF